MSVENLDNKSLFGEAPTQVLIAIKPQHIQDLHNLITNSNLQLEKVATLGGENIEIGNISIPLQEAKRIYFDSFKEIIQTL